MSITAADIEERIAVLQAVENALALCNCPDCFEGEALYERSSPENFHGRHTIARHWQRMHAMYLDQDLHIVRDTTNQAQQTFESYLSTL